ncbi:MAG: Cof-type HAD-IIB family hydrolase [Treponema sp.]|jgi:Cof subfamily protein (haloacid dehalogenase superfamily)|nr:Cof-type HAD-IIB family hydrolase [Treponema sp.]
MNPVRLLALNLDDTLLRSDLSISQQTKNAIKQAEDEGVTLVLASSRTSKTVEEYARVLNMNKRSGYLISNDGALVQESLTGNVVHETKIEPGITLMVCDFAEAESFPVQLYEDDIMYVSRMNEYASYDEKLTGIRQVVVENFRAMASRGCYKLLVPGEPALLSSLRTIYGVYIGKDITIINGNPYFIELLPPQTCKGTALALVAGILGLGSEEVMAIGDSQKDEAMIRWAGLGIAMVNGHDKIKDIADFVTEYSNDEDGVANVIEKFILKKG